MKIIGKKKDKVGRERYVVDTGLQEITIHRPHIEQDITNADEAIVKANKNKDRANKILKMLDEYDKKNA